MADQLHLSLIKIGVKAFNEWREKRPDIKPNLIKADLRAAELREANLSHADLRMAYLSDANLSRANLFWAELSRANLSGANLSHAHLRGAQLRGALLHNTDLSEADLRGANLWDAKLGGANLSRANLREANLFRADLSQANLSGANLSNSDLTEVNLTQANLNVASLVETNLEGADLSNSSVYGISAWNLKINEKTQQRNLVITNKGEPVVTVDDIKLAQFIYLIMTNSQIRDVINTVANKAVLILGRFTEKRKEVLDAIADKLRTMDLVPIIFDFKPPEKQDIIETVIILASLSKFIIADVTAGRVIADELRSFAPDLTVPVVPVFQPSKKEPKPYASLYTLYRKYDWVFEPVLYKSKEHLIKILPDEVIKPAEDKRSEWLDIK